MQTNFTPSSLAIRVSRRLTASCAGACIAGCVRRWCSTYVVSATTGQSARAHLSHEGDVRERARTQRGGARHIDRLPVLFVLHDDVSVRVDYMHPRRSCAGLHRGKGAAAGQGALHARIAGAGGALSATVPLGAARAAPFGRPFRGLMRLLDFRNSRR